MNAAKRSEIDRSDDNVFVIFIFFPNPPRRPAHALNGGLYRIRPSIRSPVTEPSHTIHHLPQFAAAGAK
jgi:hypothetical protein